MHGTIILIFWWSSHFEYVKLGIPYIRQRVSLLAPIPQQHKWELWLGLQLQTCGGWTKIKKLRRENMFLNIAMFGVAAEPKCLGREDMFLNITMFGVAAEHCNAMFGERKYLLPSSSALSLQCVWWNLYKIYKRRKSLRFLQRGGKLPVVIL